MQILWTLFTFILVSCGSKSTIDDTFLLSRRNYVYHFNNSNEYTFNSNYVEIAGSQAGLKVLDFSTNTASEFALGTHDSTQFSSSRLQLDLATAVTTELDASWTPQFANLDAYWKFDGNVLDATGNGHNGALIGDTTYVADAQVGSNSTIYDDDADRVQIAGIGVLDFGAEFTISVWIKKSVVPAANLDYIYSGYDCTPGCVGSALAVTVGTCRVAFFDSGTTWYSGTTNICDGVWHHIGVTYNAGTLHMFLDGKIEVSSAALSASIPASNSVKAIGGFSVGGTLSIDGKLDDFALWDTQLLDDEITYVYHRQKSKYAGLYTSQVFDLGSAAGNWNSLGWQTPLPFGKQAPATDAANENTSQYSETQSVFENNFLANYSLDNLTDSTGNNPNGFVVGNTFFSTNNIIGTKSVSLDGVGDYIQVTGPTNFDFQATNDFTISGWFRTFSDTGTSMPLLYMAGNPTGYVSIVLNTGTGFLSTTTRDSDFNTILTCTGVTNVIDGRWHHFSVVRDNSADKKYLYLDGKLEKSCNDVRPGGFNMNGNMFFGWQFGVTFHGQLDEFNFWDRDLGGTEVLELYQRGVSETRYQVRSCTMSDCSDGSWQGPDGTGGTWFTESQNCDSINGSGVCNGNINGTKPNLVLGGFPTPPSDNQYFQYKAFLGTRDLDDSCDNNGDLVYAEPCVPKVEAISVNSNQVSYFTEASIVTNNITNYREIVSMTSDAPSCVLFQVTSNRSVYHYWDGASWAVATDSASDANTLADIFSHIASYQSDTQMHALYFRIYFTSDSTTACSIDYLNIDSILRY